MSDTLFLCVFCDTQSNCMEGGCRRWRNLSLSNPAPQVAGSASPGYKASEPPAVAGPTPRTDAIRAKWSRNTGNRNGCDASPEAIELYEHADQLERALRRVVAASDRFIEDTGLKHGDLITDAVEQARNLL